MQACWSLFLVKLPTDSNRLQQACNYMFYCEYCEIFKNCFFIEHLWWLLLNQSIDWHCNSMYWFLHTCNHLKKFFWVVMWVLEANICCKIFNECLIILWTLSVTKCLMILTRCISLMKLGQKSILIPGNRPDGNHPLA